MKKTVKILAVAALVVLCASCTKTASKCKCTVVTLKDGEEYRKTEMEMTNPGRCSDLNSNITTSSDRMTLDQITTCVEI